MGNRLTGEDRDVITSKLTLAAPAQPAPGYRGLTIPGPTCTYPFDSKNAAAIRRALTNGDTVIRAWDVLWPADGSAPSVINDTGYLNTPDRG